MNSEWDENDLNARLAEAHQEYAKGMTKPKLPVVFIIGAGRTGTTLVSQMLSASGRFSYISNIAAKFPDIPAIGMMVSEKLKPLIDDRSNHHVNSYGRTEGLLDPHEFGYFWNRWFEMGQDTHNLTSVELANLDKVDLLSELAAMESVDNKPLLFKNNTWISLQASFIATLLPSSVFVVCRRNPVFVVQSHLFGREQQYGDRESWWSIRPSTLTSLKKLSLWDQIVGQVIDIEHEMDSELSTISPARIVNVKYEDLCLNPSAVFLDICNAVSSQGFTFDGTFSPPNSFKSTNTQKLSDPEWCLLNEAVERKTAASY